MMTTTVMRLNKEGTRTWSCSHVIINNNNIQDPFHNYYQLYNAPCSMTIKGCAKTNFLNLSSQEMKQMAIQMLQNDLPVLLACNVMEQEDDKYDLCPCCWCHSVLLFVMWLFSCCSCCQHAVIMILIIVSQPLLLVVLVLFCLFFCLLSSSSSSSSSLSS